MRIKSLLAAGIVGLCLASGAQAQIFNVPVPTNAYITQSGFDWAWASPLPGDGSFFGPAFAIDLTFQGTQGWRLPTAQELLLAPLATDFLVPGGNVPFNGVDGITGANFAGTDATYASAQSAGALAVPYFHNTFKHADWDNGLGQANGPWAGMPGAATFAEQLVIRGRGNGSAAPEPATGLLALAGMGVVAFVARRKRNA